MIGRLGRSSKAPLAVAAILATPLFFVALMAMSLAVEKPTVHEAIKKGKLVHVLGDPTGSTEAKIWLLAVLPSLGLLAIGTASILLGRVGVATTAVGAIALAVALMLPLGTWDRRHSARFPLGIDNIPLNAPGSSDIYLRGEWEGTAKRTAEQLGAATIVIAGGSIAVLVLLELRRRRGSPVVPPPPEIAITR